MTPVSRICAGWLTRRLGACPHHVGLRRLRAFHQPLRRRYGRRFQPEEERATQLLPIVLHDRPDITGLAVPGMPMGSPGMGDDPSARYDVIAFGGEAGTGMVYYRAGTAQPFDT